MMDLVARERGDSCLLLSWRYKKTASSHEAGGWFRNAMSACLIGGGNDVDAGAVFVEEHLTSAQGEQGVIFAHAYVRASGPASAALTNDDVARDDSLATEFFHAKAFAA